MFDIVAMGELLIDFPYYGNSKRGYPLFEANPGGAPANVAVGAKKLGANTAFIGKVGNDFFGEILKKTLLDNGVDVSGLLMDDNYNTALAFVSHNENGDRSFSFYRSDSADININEEEIDTGILSNSRSFHFGSVSMTQEPSRSATLFTARTAREKGLIVSYDPNFRPLLWNDLDNAKVVIKSALDICHILKVSEEELVFLTGIHDIDKGMKKISQEYCIPIIFTTLGPKGCRWLYDGTYGSADAYEVHTVDTTGAGDSFVAAVLYKIVCEFGGLDSLTAEHVRKAAEFACAVSSLTTSVMGAIPAMPDMHQVLNFIDMKRK